MLLEHDALATLHGRKCNHNDLHVFKESLVYVMFWASLITYHRTISSTACLLPLFAMMARAYLQRLAALKEALLHQYCDNASWIAASLW